MESSEFLRETLPEIAGLQGNIQLVGFSGLRKAGKTTAARLLRSASGNRFRVLSLSTPLKQEFAAMNGIQVAELDDVVAKEQYRPHIQRHSEANLKADPYHYVKLLFRGVVPGESIAIDDLRTFYELRVLLALGGLPFQVYTDPYVRRDRGFVYNKEVDNHFTETELGNLSWYTFHKLGGGRLWNNGTEAELETQLLLLLKRHFL